MALCYVTLRYTRKRQVAHTKREIAVFALRLRRQKGCQIGQLRATYVWILRQFPERWLSSVLLVQYKAARKLTKPCQLLILHTILQKPGIFLCEIQREIEEMLLVSVSLSTICKFIYQSGFTRQRLRNVALQQDAFQREQYKSDVSVYTPEMFVFVDETGADRRNTLRKYGYSMRGRLALNHSHLIRGERISAIACISLHGLLDVKTVKGTSNGDTFTILFRNIYFLI